MKLNKLVMVALVALGAVACEKSDKGIDDQSPKSVTINLANVQAGSRSEGKPLTTNDQVVLTRFQVFLLMVQLCTWVRRRMEMKLTTILLQHKEILIRKLFIFYLQM